MRSKISLLPDEFKKKNKLKQQMLMIITVAGSIAILLAIVFASVFTYRIYLNSDLSNILDEKSAVQLEISRMKKYEDIDKKTKTLESLFTKVFAGSTDWEKYFIRLTESVPGGISLDSTSATVGKGNDVQLTYVGSAISRYQIADWMEVLKAMPEMSNVSCPSTTKKGSPASYSFTITATLNVAIAAKTPVIKPGEVNSK